LALTWEMNVRSNRNKAKLKHLRLILRMFYVFLLCYCFLLLVQNGVCRDSINSKNVGEFEMSESLHCQLFLVGLSGIHVRLSYLFLLFFFCYDYLIETVIGCFFCSKFYWLVLINVHFSRPNDVEIHILLAHGISYFLYSLYDWIMSVNFIISYQTEYRP